MTTGRRPPGSARSYPGTVGDEPSGDVAHAEMTELDALRRRAYGPDADIFSDAEALLRLSVLEERVRRTRYPSPAAAPPPSPRAAENAEPDAGSPAVPPQATPDEPSPPLAPGRRAPRWHSALVAATAAVALLLGGTEWTAARLSAAEALAAENARIAASVNEQRDASYRASYRLYIEGLRDDVLTLAGTERISDRMIRNQLRPHGLLYGRTVGVGPTLDHRFCMIIADLPEASITCIPVENAYANPVTVLLPAWYADADSDVFTGLGELVAYTLMPGGIVIAEPADAADVAIVPDAAPGATAVPTPGGQ